MQSDVDPGVLVQASSSSGDTDALLAAALSVAAESDETGVLVNVVQAAREVTGARYGALAEYGPDGSTSRFLHSGVPDETISAIGTPPRGHGVLSRTALAAGPLRIADVTVHPTFGGLPAHHHGLGPFLGVQIRSGGRWYGNLYVANGPGETPFTVQDETTLATLAAFAACAIDGARLLEGERQRVELAAHAAVEEERSRLRAATLADLLNAQEQERARVSRDLHDEIGQSLTGVLLGLHLVESSVRAEPFLAGSAVERIADVRGLVTHALAEVRRLAAGLRPTVLDDLGLVAALERLVADWNDRQGPEGSLTVHLSYDLSAVHRQGWEDMQARLPGPVETVVYRVVQEALTNVSRHARGTRADVDVTAAGGVVTACVRDDGRGFDIDAHRTSLGLRGMAERAALVRGTLTVESRPGAGSAVTLVVPLEEAP